MLKILESDITQGLKATIISRFSQYWDLQSFTLIETVVHYIQKRSSYTFFTFMKLRQNKDYELALFFN